MGALVFTLGASEPESVPALPTGPGRQSSLHSGWHRRGGLTGRRGGGQAAKAGASESSCSVPAAWYRDWQTLTRHGRVRPWAAAPPAASVEACQRARGGDTGTSLRDVRLRVSIQP